VREYEAKKEKEKHPSKPDHKRTKVKDSNHERSYSSKVTTTKVKPGPAGDFADIGTEIDVYVSERLSLTPHQDSKLPLIPSTETPKEKPRLDQPLVALESSTENPKEKPRLDQPLVPMEPSTENPEEKTHLDQPLLPSTLSLEISDEEFSNDLPSRPTELTTVSSASTPLRASSEEVAVSPTLPTSSLEVTASLESHAQPTISDKEEFSTPNLVKKASALLNPTPIKPAQLNPYDIVSRIINQQTENDSVFKAVSPVMHPIISPSTNVGINKPQSTLTSPEIENHLPRSIYMPYSSLSESSPDSSGEEYVPRKKIRRTDWSSATEPLNQLNARRTSPLVRTVTTPIQHTAAYPTGPSTLPPTLPSPPMKNLFDLHMPIRYTRTKVTEKDKETVTEVWEYK
jgi:hypothetical protein